MKFQSRPGESSDASNVGRPLSSRIGLDDVHLVYDQECDDQPVGFKGHPSGSDRWKLQQASLGEIVNKSKLRTGNLLQLQSMEGKVHDESVSIFQGEANAVTTDPAYHHRRPCHPHQVSEASKDQWQQHLLAEIGQMLDDRFRKHFAQLEKMLLESKCNDKVDVEHKQLEINRTSTVDESNQEPQDSARLEERRSLQGLIDRSTVRDGADIIEAAMKDEADEIEDQMYSQFFKKGGNPETFDVLPRNIMRHLGLAHYLPTEMPKTRLARATKTWWFLILEALLIISATFAAAIDTDQQMKAVLQVPKGELSDEF